MFGIDLTGQGSDHQHTIISKEIVNFLLVQSVNFISINLLFLVFFLSPTVFLVSLVSKVGVRAIFPFLT